MRKILFFILTLFFTLSNSGSFVLASDTNENMQAVWMTTVYNVDFPSTKNDMATQKYEYIKKLDKLKSIGINTIVVQIRPKSDSLYKSDINPWSDVLTGTQGQYPGYDPMAFMIEEAHKRGLAFHAWLNPYRITTSGTDLNSLCPSHPARLHPEWVIAYNNALYYNPELTEVKNYITATVQEIVKNYNVDAIHFDDYFYPSNYPLPPGEGIDGTMANSRRQHVNDMIKQVSEAIKAVNSSVLFGVSPMGIWKNNTTDITGSNTSGTESYYYVYGDTRTWIKNHWIDYIVPQIYWETGNTSADYETLVKWWSDEVKGTNVKLYIGQGIYKETVAGQIDSQLNINKKYPEVLGSFYYGMGNLLSNTSGCLDKISAFNQAIPSQDTPNSYLEKGITSASTLNIRSGGGLGYSIIASAPWGTEVTILGSIPGWYNVKLPNGQVGWASAYYIRIPN
ncbi:MAG: family 10 glycosylhydrolase [Solirubrobacterales bacterium]